MSDLTCVAEGTMYQNWLFRRMWVCLTLCDWDLYASMSDWMWLTECEECMSGCSLCEILCVDIICLNRYISLVRLWEWVCYLVGVLFVGFFLSLIFENFLLTAGSTEFSAHVASDSHEKSDLQYSVLCYDDNWYQRGVKEAIAINKLKPTLNQDEGRHHLSPIYSKLIRSSVVLKTSDKKANDDSEAVNFWRRRSTNRRNTYQGTSQPVSLKKHKSKVVNLVQR